MTISTAVLLLKRRLLKIGKSPVLQSSGNNNSKSRYRNDLNLFMAFLDNYLYAVEKGFSFTKSPPPKKK